MTTERRGLFVFRTDDTGTKCAAECPHVGVDARGSDYETRFCNAFGGEHMTYERPFGWVRHYACVEVESAAREAEVDALQRGYDIAAREGFTEAVDYGSGACGSPRIHWDIATDVLNAEIERIRRGES